MGRDARDGSLVGAVLCMVAVVVLFSSEAHCQEPGASQQATAGALAVLSEKAAVTPVFQVGVDAPLYLGEDNAVARLHARLTIAGQAGQALDVERVETFNGAELELYLERRIGAGLDGGATYLHAQAGGSARRDANGLTPAERFPLWYGIGVTVERRSGDSFPSRRLSVSLGRSEISSPRTEAEGASRFVRDLIVSGSVSVPAGPVLLLVHGDAHRALWGEGARFSARVGVSVAWRGRQ